MPSVTSQGSKYDAIPGPLGLASASLEGKVALVTGAGAYPFFPFSDFTSYVVLLLISVTQYLSHKQNKYLRVPSGAQ
ncbi:hypothetical protein M434DRAFT_399787 [Hypoxylon sp. CO27-5]|nr:hypothetical protein M434DRAFT_399787 [Hypoxylon sp. CO27-5]